MKNSIISKSETALDGARESINRENDILRQRELVIISFRSEQTSYNGAVEESKRNEWK
jgi:hypothetical protein